MSITANNEKLSLLSWLQPQGLPIPIPAGGAFDQGDLQHLLAEYAGVLWAE